MAAPDEERRPHQETGVPSNPSHPCEGNQHDDTCGVSQRRAQVRQWHHDYGFELVADTPELDVYTKRLFTGSYIVVAIDCGGTSPDPQTATLPAREVVDAVARHLMGAS